jgi:glycosyltransferase involved in cell wall biosynthesis
LMPTSPRQWLPRSETNMLKIHYDGIIYMLQAAGGVNKYFTNLIQRLPETFQPSLTVYRQRDLNLPRHRNLRITRYNVFRPALLCSSLRPFFFRGVYRWNKPDVVHPTYYSLLTGTGISAFKCPVVLTVHDFMLEKFKEELDPTGAHAVIKSKAITAADTIICVSESTKRDLLERYSIPESRISVTHLASDIDPTLIRDNDAVPERQFLLYVGGRKGYKNFSGLLKALAQVSAGFPEIRLCVVGVAFSEDEQREIAHAGLAEKVLHYGQASDAQLAKLYSRCIAFVYPSLYEGFGIPPLEAMTCGAPVIACNSSSVPEVVGDAGLLFDPNRQGDLTELLETVIADGSLRERLVCRGQERAKMFNWEKTVAQTVEVYESVI